MSASDKKKLRKEQSAAILSEKQKQAQAEAKKLKIYTISFVSIIALIVFATLAILGVRLYEQSGIVEKTTIAATIGDREINTVEMNYYYADAVQEYYASLYEQYSTYTDSYLKAMGLDTSKPMTEQAYITEEYATWADYFLASALDQAKRDYAMYDLAVKDNFQLPAEDQENITTLMNSLKETADLYGYSSANKYLSNIYGNGATTKTYTEYCERSALAAAYYNGHKENIPCGEEEMAAYEKEHYNDFNSYAYSSSYLTYTEFLEGGTKGEDGTTTYSDEEKAAARAKMEAAAKEAATATSLDELKKKVEAIEVNEESQTALNSATKAKHTNINATLADWLAGEDRKEGDIAALPVNNTTTDADGNEVTELDGYYIVYFSGKNENKDPMANVRHLLVEFEGGTEDELTGEIIYSEEEQKNALEEAEGYLKTWKEGAATEESFIELVKAHSDDTSAEDGGLFEDINPDSQYVAEFLNWSIDPAREAGDAEVIKTEFGYHVMYYVGDDEMSYRDYMIEHQLRDSAQEEWFNGVLEPISTTIADTSKMVLGLTLTQ